MVTNDEINIEESVVAETQNLDKQGEKKPDKTKKTSSVSDGDKKEDQTILTPLEDYIKTASYLGTKVITPTMRKYVYRRRLDGLAILNTLLVDKKLAEGIDFIKQYKPDEWTLVCKREAGWRAAKMFAELTGVRIFTKKYPSGVLTNTVLDNFIETKMIVICDPWLDKNALADAKNIRIPVAAVCDTNNHTADVDVVMIGNNKSNKSMGLFFWLMAREYMKAHDIDKPLPSLEDFVGEQLVLEEPRKKKAAREKKEADLKTGESAIEEKMRALAEKADEEVKGGAVEEESVSVGEGAEQGV
ncbi:30S ribosomal protein S2 [archaeon]|jgi:small subunit ribosomal protein S2|nr:30S ribosomal protein S2 [archaeon]